MKFEAPKPMSPQHENTDSTPVPAHQNGQLAMPPAVRQSADDLRRVLDILSQLPSQIETLKELLRRCGPCEGHEQPAPSDNSPRLPQFPAEAHEVFVDEVTRRFSLLAKPA